MENNYYKILATLIDKKLKINNQEIINIRSSLKHYNYKIVKIKNKEEVKKYLEIFFAILKIYTDLLIINNN